MAELTRAQLSALSDSTFPDNVSRTITPALHRAFNESLIDSALNVSDDSKILTFSKTLSNAEILTSNASPVTLISAPGAGKILVPCGLWAWKLVYGSAAFATNTTYRFQYNGASSGIGSSTGTYSDTNSVYDIWTMASLTNYTPATIENKAIEFFTETGNPTGGTGSTMIIKGTYTIFTF